MLVVVVEGGSDVADVEVMRMLLLDPCGRSQRGGLYCPPQIPTGILRNPVHSSHSGGMDFWQG